MKYYFVVIIAVLVVVIFLLFFILYKIYKLHTRATDELGLLEQQELLSSLSGSKDSGAGLSITPELKDFLNDSSGSRSLEGIDGIQGKQEVDITAVQPDIKDLSASTNSLEKLKLENRRQSLKCKPHLKLILQYEKHRSTLKVTIKHIEGKLKSKLGSSETYIDVQISPYRFRTYRNPGYRRPAKSIFKRAIDFRVDCFELKTTYLLMFLLRYDPFSRLKVDGEVIVKLSEVMTQGFLEGCQAEFSMEIMKSNQEFTAFIFRPN